MFLDKLRSLFRKNDGKENLKIEYVSPRNEYYGKVSERYSTLQMVLLVALTLFILIALMINSSWISYENFYFFMSDFGNYLTTADSDMEKIIYDLGNFYDFGIFGGKLAIAGSSGIALYTSSGRAAIKSTDAIPSPNIATSERYMIVYDAGGNEYRIFNLFTEIYSEITEDAIYGATVSDNGTYAVSTLNGVDIYNRKFERIQSITRSSNVVDSALSPSGDRAAVLSYSQKDGGFITRLYLTKTSKTEGYANISLEKSFPLYCDFTEKGYVNLVCDNRIVSYNTSGTQITEYRYPEGYSVADVDINRYGCSLLLRGDGNNIILMFDKSGEMVYNKVLHESIESVALYGEYIYLLGAREVIRLDSRSDGRKSVERDTVGDVRMLVKDEDRVLLCMSSRVKYADFS